MLQDVLPHCVATSGCWQAEHAVRPFALEYWPGGQTAHPLPAKPGRHCTQGPGTLLTSYPKLQLLPLLLLLIWLVEHWLCPTSLAT